VRERMRAGEKKKNERESEGWKGERERVQREE